MRKSLISFAALALFSANLMAQEDSDYTQYYNPNGWSYNIALSHVGLDSDTAGSQGIEDTAIAIGFGFNYRESSWVTSIDADFILYDDNNEFSEVVVGDGLFNNGDISTESSEASALALSVATGYEWRFGQDDRASAILQGGFSGVFASERSIANCSNCGSQDIDIDGGAFIGGKLAFNQESFSVGLNVRQYVSGDGLSSMVGIVFDTQF
ncbi:hypothetical protein ISG33_09235 [Glaciecola sp. MH2013]|uniref:hypothetical protein n=1 Tax=Glaciecola sp. MH2013 TaxID=2785524 RepID=UPI00189EAE82|nr:hypothetical protein [Glaciecola sp. MH2013]MBF7073575.1 hypothetical protein [Glaciecola sp. MH2013]